MEKSFTNGQIASALHQANVCESVAEVIHKPGIIEQAFYHWIRSNFSYFEFRTLDFPRIDGG